MAGLAAALADLAVQYAARSWFRHKSETSAMTRLQKKCLIGSAVAHGMLLVVVFVGSAFIPPAPKTDATFVELVTIPDFLVDEDVVGGGSPDAQLPAAAQQLIQQAAPAAAVIPEVKEEPKPEPRPPEPVKAQPKPEPPQDDEPEPVVEKPKKPPVDDDKKRDDKSDPDSVRPKDSRKKPQADAGESNKPKKPKVNLDSRVKRTIKTGKATASDSSDDSPAEAAKAAQATAAARAAKLAAAIGTINSKASGGTTIGIPGPGGPAYAGYGIYLKDLYEKTWIPPVAARDNEPIVEAEVVISRNGKVISAKITKKSGNNSLDASVQSTLNRIRQVRPLPDGTPDAQRTFKINFNLSTKQGIG